jgi:autotransporter-associated beta strand protein
MMTLNGGTFAVPNGSGDLYLRYLRMTGGTVDLTGANGFSLHFGGSPTGAYLFGSSTTWAGSNARIVNDTSGPLQINVNNTSNGQFYNPGLIVGVALSGSGRNAEFDFNGGVVRLSNTHNTASISPDGCFLLSNDLSTDIGAGAFGTLGTGAITLIGFNGGPGVAGAGLVYDGPTATCTKPLSILGSCLIGVQGNDPSSPTAANLTLAGPISNSHLILAANGYVASTSMITLTGMNTYSGGTEVYFNLQVGNGGKTGTLGTGDLLDDYSVVFNRSDDNTFPGNVSGPGTLTKAGSNTLTITGTYMLTGTTTISGGTLALNSAASYTLAGAINGAGALSKGGGGILTLTGLNTYSGGTVINSGGITVAADANLSAGDVSGGPAGVLTFTGSTSTTKRFNMGGGTITVATGKTLTFNGSLISAAFLDGTGTFATGTAGAQFVNVTTTPSVAITSNSAADAFRNITNSAGLTVAPGINTAGTSTNVTFNNFVNQGLGSVTVSASSQVNVSNFQTYGTLTLNPGSGANPTQMTNLGNAPLGFNTGSRTFISIPAHAGSFDAGIDLHGQNAVIAGGLFVNNGYVVDSTNTMPPVTVIADYGALVKGAGFYQTSVQTVNGGKFQSGNSPGQTSFGRFTFGPAGVSNYIFAIDDATGMAGPNPDAGGQVSGWGLVKAVRRLVGSAATPGDFTWTADASHPLFVHLDTLVNPTTVGTDISGPMTDFDPAKPYSWLAVQWTGAYTGPTDPVTLNSATAFDTTGFANSVAGAFGWNLDLNGRSMFLTYTPAVVPEPSALALASATTVGWFTLRRLRRGRPTRKASNRFRWRQASETERYYRRKIQTVEIVPSGGSYFQRRRLVWNP